MKICKKCGNSFPYLYKDENGKRWDFRRRVYCLDCNPFGKRNIWNGNNTSQLTGNSRNSAKTFTCKICKRDRTQTGRNVICRTCRSRLERAKKKQKALDYLGNNCKRCGYNKCKNALTFHHTDPKKKEFQISYCWGWNFERLKKELDKCILLCHNCHAEVHEENGFPWELTDI